MTSAGRRHFKKTEGANLRPPVKGKPKSDREKSRKVSFAARFAGMKGPMKDEKGKPTRKALALKKWGFGYVEAARRYVRNNRSSA